MRVYSVSTRFKPPLTLAVYFCFLILFIYFLVVLCLCCCSAFSLVVESEGYSLVAGFSLQWLLLLSMGARVCGFQ